MILWLSSLGYSPERKTKKNMLNSCAHFDNREWAVVVLGRRGWRLWWETDQVFFYICVQLRRVFDCLFLRQLSNHP